MFFILAIAFFICGYLHMVLGIRRVETPSTASRSCGSLVFKYATKCFTCRTVLCLCIPWSTTSCNSRNMAISPHSFSMWTEEDGNIKSQRSGEDSIRLSILTPHSDLGMAEGTLSGTTTPLPIFFDQPSSEERENRTDQSRSARKKKSGDTDHIHHLFVSNGGRGSADKGQKGHMHHFWSKEHGAPTPVGSGPDGGPPMGLPPTPLFAASEFGRDDGFVRSPLHGGDRHRDDFFPSNAMYGHPGSAGHDRVRSLRG